MLDNIRIVLINTTHPGNIGGVARAMKNMGLSRLYLVEPKSFPHEKSYFRAVSATDILNNAVVCETLDEAIGDCHLVVGTSARSRSIPWPMMEPRECGEALISEPDNHEIAILFGREDRGLTNEELHACNFHLHIPSNPEYSALNIAAAVQVVCYELRMAALVKQDAGEQQGELWSWGTEWDEEAASSKEVELFFEHLERTLIEIKVINPRNPRQLMTRMKRLYRRARPDKTEIGVLRGILTATQQARKTD